MPRSAGVVTADVLGRVLGSAVAKVESTLIGHFSCELWRLDVLFATGNKQTVVLKRPKQEPNRDPMDSERRFYERYGGALESSPRYLGYIEEIDGILLEFIEGLEAFDWRAGPTRQHAEDSVAALAALHRVDPGEVDWLPRFDAERVQRIADEYDKAWPARRKMLLGFCPDYGPTGDHILGRVGDALEQLNEPLCLLHGDAHGENIPARSGGGVCMLDWQDPVLGNPGVDVADYLLMSYKIQDRCRIQDAFIEQHASLFDRQGYDATIGFRLGALQRVVRTVCSAHAFPGWAESSLPWVFDRCATGAVAADVAALV